MAPSVARLAMILSIFSSLFLLSLARHPIDVATQPETQIETLLPKESNTTVLTLNPNETTDLDILESIEKVEEGIDAQLSNLALPDESSERQVVVDSDPGMIPSEVIGSDPREDKEKKQEAVVRKKKSKKLDESDSDSDSDSDDEDEEEERKKRKKKKKGKKSGFWWFFKWINPFH
jgi:hypothetical protein